MSDKSFKLDVSLPRHTWEKRTSLIRLIQVFKDAKAEIRLIGGFIRNALLDLPSTDIDLATPLLPNKTVELLKIAGIDYILPGVKYGTVTAKIKGDEYQITTLREDISNDGRRAKVKYTDCWKTDASRRDFTINAMSANLEGEIYDYFSGYNDLVNGKIRFVGSAEKRITEDHLRILRYFRFMANLDFQPASDQSYDTCIKHAHLTNSLSGERIWSELRKILSLSSQIKIIEKMINDGITDHFLAQNVNTKYLVRIYELANEHPSLNAIVDQPILLLACLLKDKEINIGEIATKLKLSNKESAKLSKLLSPDTQMNSEMSKIELNGKLYRNGRNQFLSNLVLSWAMEQEQSNGSKLNHDNWLKLLKKATSIKEKVFPVKGRDLIDRGIPEGPEVSDILKNLEDWWVKNGCKADKTACLKRL